MKLSNLKSCSRLLMFFLSNLIVFPHAYGYSFNNDNRNLSEIGDTVMNISFQVQYLPLIDDSANIYLYSEKDSIYSYNKDGAFRWSIATRYLYCQPIIAKENLIFASGSQISFCNLDGTNKHSVASKGNVKTLMSWADSLLVVVYQNSTG